MRDWVLAAGDRRGKPPLFVPITGGCLSEKPSGKDVVLEDLLPVDFKIFHCTLA
jgi:hypothetical protein